MENKQKKLMNRDGNKSGKEKKQNIGKTGFSKRTSKAPSGTEKRKPDVTLKKTWKSGTEKKKRSASEGDEKKAKLDGAVKANGGVRTDRMERPNGSSRQAASERSGKRSFPQGQFCPAEKKCGGCQFLSLSNEEQLAKKQKTVSILMKPFCTVHKITGMEQPLHYRNKVHAVFSHKRDGEIVSGIYEEGSHKIVPVEECLLEDAHADAIIRDIRGLLKSFHIKTYNEDSGYGLFRHVLIRTAHKTGQVMVVLVLASPILPSKNNFVKALRKLHPEITTVVLNVNDKKTSMVLGEREIVLYGKGYIEDELCGCRFRISPKSFYQINSVQTEALYGKAMELAGLTGTERVIDAYCGIGTIGLVAAKHAGEVIGVELNRDAVRDAVRNAKMNDARNTAFYENDAGIFMTQMADEGESADVVFMDPPRAGSDEAFLSSVLRLGPKKIVYISCNPETLARDVKYLTKHGYAAKGCWPYDMFPFCDHVETVCLLSNRKPDTKVRIDVDLEDYYRIKDSKKNQD